MPAPSLNDKGLFFSNVLIDPGFQRDGYLFGQEAGIGRSCHWVVIDPNRHAMRVWSKPIRSMDFLAAAKGLGATAFSNGPYWRSNATAGNALKYYALGYLRQWVVTKQKLDPHGTAKMLGVDALTWATAAEVTAGSLLVDLFPGSATRPAAEAAVWDQTAIECFGGPPCGTVVQKGIPIYTPPQISLAPAKHGEYVNAHIARGKGMQFKDYSIESYSSLPTGMEEVMGGVSLAIWDWQDAYLRAGYGSGNGANQWVSWGLAELTPTVEFFVAAEHASLAKAIQAYQKADAARGQVTGLIFGLCSWADAQVLRIKMIGIGVKEAVTLDTSDSAMFGGGSKILWGDAMVDEKRKAQNFGIAFFPT